MDGMKILSNLVLSHSVAVEERGDGEVVGTAEFCKMMNDFFDCAYVGSLTEHARKRNNFIKQYRGDDWFVWPKDVFLEFLELWRQSALVRERNYSADDRSKMFFRIQTYKGLKISVFSHIEAVTFLLS